MLEDLKTHLSYLQERIQAARQAIQQHIDQNPSLKSQQELLASIPGIGQLTAARLLAEIGEISAFEDAPQLPVYAGLNPKGFRSGSSVHKKTHISKEGRAFLRHILYMPAIVAKQHNNIEAEKKGRTDAGRIIVIGAHYDSVLGSPGANDNASGIAALLALSRGFAEKQAMRTIRFVAFSNEEPPFFWTKDMGSYGMPGVAKSARRVSPRCGRWKQSAAIMIKRDAALYVSAWIFLSIPGKLYRLCIKPFIKTAAQRNCFCFSPERIVSL